MRNIEYHSFNRNNTGTRTGMHDCFFFICNQTVFWETLNKIVAPFWSKCSIVGNLNSNWISIYMAELEELYLERYPQIQWNPVNTVNTTGSKKYGCNNTGQGQISYTPLIPYTFRVQLYSLYCAFQKNANSEVQKPPSQLRFSLPSILITITSNELWHSQTH